ncbi:MAG: sigma 54-interacting transcriptional regulator [Eubacteriaceae bacterium]|jgi:transcriptional regulator with AAA-type ATPase domain/transcriptional regulatory protein LevR/mannitol/fructose-specific phosphotransferase system IIA component|nr:sigma 54-interacting transcriptional regulator [Eubacteriaceae bacterium]
MKDKIVELISSEDIRNPYKDDEIAKILGLSRYDVIRLRRENGIESYNDRRLPALRSEIEEIMRDDQKVTIVELTKQINERGFDVSRFIVAKLRDEVKAKIDEIIVHDEEKKQDNVVTNSSDLIGEDGSINEAVQKMRAAMLYPPYGLNTIVIGQTGTGKSKLVDSIYRQLLESGKISPDRKMIKYNCANYANNPELLASQLFGHVKGAFTGADANHDGIIASADKGILFLDEIHRLSKEGQEMLFSVIDDGIYHKLGKGTAEEHIDVMIIGATTEPIDSTILETFKRRIPMIIEMPPLAERGINERFQLITSMLRKEAGSIRKNIMLSSDSLVSLLTYACPGNIGQLASDIKVAVASAYLESDPDEDAIEIKIKHFQKDVHKGNVDLMFSAEIGYYRDHGIMVAAGGGVTFLDEKWIDVKPSQICEMLYLLYQDMSNQKLPDVLISNLLYRDLEYRINTAVKMSRIASDSAGSEASGGTLETKEITNSVVDNLEKNGGSLRPDVRNCLRSTLTDIIRKINSGWHFPDISIHNVEQNHLMDYRIAYESLMTVSKQYGIDFPAIVFSIVALYLHIGSMENSTDNDLRIVIITHGSTASSIAETCNHYLKAEIVRAIDLPLNMPKHSYEDYIIEKVAEIDEENLLLLVDIGTTLMLGEVIAEKTSKRTKTVGRVDLGLAMAAATKVKAGHSQLNEVYDYVKDKNTHTFNSAVSGMEPASKLIILSCITGQGAANSIKKYLEDNYGELMDGIEIIPFGVVTEEISEYISELVDSNKIIACIGSYHIQQIDGVPYIKISDLLHENGKKTLKWILEKEHVSEIQRIDLSSFIRPDVIFLDKKFLNKEDAIAYAADRLIELGYVKEEYKQGVLEREGAVSTDYRNGVALPHTSSEYVIDSVIAMARFGDPVPWAPDFEADIMFMIALKGQDVKVINKLGRLVKNDKCRERLLTADKQGILDEIRRFDMNN